MYKQKSYREGFTDPLPREGLMMNRMAVLHQNEGGIVSVLHQNERGIEIFPDAQEISRDPRYVSTSRGSLEISTVILFIINSSILP